MRRRPSQLAAWRHIIDTGALTKRREEVYDWVARHPGNWTAGEIARGLERSVGRRDRGATSCRCGELVELGVFAELPERACTVSGQAVIAYDMTDNLPYVPASRHHVKEVNLKLIFTDDTEPRFDEDQLVQLAGDGLVDYDIDTKRRKAKDHEVRLIRRRDG